MDNINILHILSIIGAVEVGRLISFIANKYFRDKETQFMDFEILTRIPLFLVFFVSAIFSLHTPALNLGALHVDGVSIANTLMIPAAIFLGMLNQRYGILKLKGNMREKGAALGLLGLYSVALLTLLTLLALPAGGFIVQALATAGGLAYLAAVVLLFRAIGRIFG